MKNIFVFPGQGAQEKGMACDFYESSKAAKKVIDDMSSILGQDIYALLRDTETVELSRSDKSQVAITAASLAIVAALKEKGIEPDMCAGFSLGEFPALYTSGILSFTDTVKLVQKRGQIMQEVCDEFHSVATPLNCNENTNSVATAGMAAVIGLSPEDVQSLIATYSDITRPDAVFATNLNSPKQTVVSGTDAGLVACEKICKEAGARRFIRLKVAGPFHSPLMNKAAERFSKVLESVKFMDPVIPCLSNVTGKAFTSGIEAAENAVKHIVQPVRWTEEEHVMAEFIAAVGKDTAVAESAAVSTESVSAPAGAGVAKCRLLEVGPGKVLSGLWRDSGYAETAPVFVCGKYENIDQLGKE